MAKTIDDGNTPLHYLADSLPIRNGLLWDDRVDWMALNNRNQTAFDIILGNDIFLLVTMKVYMSTYMHVNLYTLISLIKYSTLINYFMCCRNNRLQMP